MCWTISGRFVSNATEGRGRSGCEKTSAVAVESVRVEMCESSDRPNSLASSAEQCRAVLSSAGSRAYDIPAPTSIPLVPCSPQRVASQQSLQRISCSAQLESSVSLRQPCRQVTRRVCERPAAKIIEQAPALSPPRAQSHNSNRSAARMVSLAIPISRRRLRRSQRGQYSRECARVPSAH